MTPHAALHACQTAFFLRHCQHIWIAQLFLATHRHCLKSTEEFLQAWVSLIPTPTQDSISSTLTSRHDILAKFYMGVQACNTELEAENNKSSVLLDEAEEQLAEAQQDLADARAQLEEAEGQLAAAREELEAVKQIVRTQDGLSLQPSESADDSNTRYPSASQESLLPR